VKKCNRAFICHEGQLNKIVKNSLAGLIRANLTLKIRPNVGQGI